MQIGVVAVFMWRQRCLVAFAKVEDIEEEEDGDDDNSQKKEQWKLKLSVFESGRSCEP